MKKFFLIVFGNFESEDICKEIALTVTPLVDSPHLKFNHSQGNLIFHFASEVSQEEIHDYLIGSLFDICNSFILSENTDKVSLFLPKEVKEHLLDLDSDSNNVEMKINLNAQTKIQQLGTDDEFVALLLEEVKRKVKKPSLDQLLEKISLQGIDSLSQYEKDTLDDYSKN